MRRAFSAISANRNYVPKIEKDCQVLNKNSRKSKEKRKSAAQKEIKKKIGNQTNKRIQREKQIKSINFADWKRNQGSIS